MNPLEANITYEEHDIDNSNGDFLCVAEFDYQYQRTFVSCRLSEFPSSKEMKVWLIKAIRETPEAIGSNKNLPITEELMGLSA